ncbi:hypothetical protein L1987_55146 [Smallanthus sonchifolius]|uniref:Uncharacterized protein n=1 Tax=Smallanthus sonchifolius TaxID=185202 RepID=A0ACB9E8R7_9ASTR|nr:hypothetical protein L1987_55146 [Smallanthus sonchifolius]
MILNLHHTDRPANSSPTRMIMLVEPTTAATPARQRQTCKLKSFSDPDSDSYGCILLWRQLGELSKASKCVLELRDYSLA